MLHIMLSIIISIINYLIYDYTNKRVYMTTITVFFYLNGYIYLSIYHIMYNFSDLYNNVTYKKITTPRAIFDNNYRN